MPISLISMTNRPKKIKKSKKKILAREIPCFHPYILYLHIYPMVLLLRPRLAATSLFALKAVCSWSSPRL